MTTLGHTTLRTPAAKAAMTSIVLPRHALAQVIAHESYEQPEGTTCAKGSSLFARPSNLDWNRPGP
jgi:hypothetical protein